MFSHYQNKRYKHVKSNFLLLFIVIISLIFQSSFYAQRKDKDLHSAVSYLSCLIASDYFIKLKSCNTGLALIDTLYLRATDYYGDDKSEALLALSIATLTFNEMSVTLPILGIKFNVPLPSMPDSIFIKRLHNMPGNFLIDSPFPPNSDKDKLPHFFGSAFLSFNLGFFNFSKFIGILVELFEETFKVQGRVDNRDLLINNLGDLFGSLLNKKDDILPSQVLKLNTLRFIKYKFL